MTSGTTGASPELEPASDEDATPGSGPASDADAGPASDAENGAGAGIVPLSEVLDEVHRLVRHARRSADAVVLGTLVGAEVDAIVADLARHEAAGVTEGDRDALMVMAARARTAIGRARLQGRARRSRTVAGMAAIHLGSGTRPSSPSPSP